MNLARKLLLLPAALLLGLPACDTCGPFKPGYVDVRETLLVAERAMPGSSAAVLGAGETVSAAELQLLLRLTGPVYSANRPAAGLAAVACEPADPQYTEVVDSLRVTSRYAFDAAHPAGVSLNDVVRTTDYGGRPVTLAALLVTPQPAGQLKDKILGLIQPPAGAGPQQFRVRVHLTNGEVYTAETPAVSVIP